MQLVLSLLLLAAYMRNGARSRICKTIKEADRTIAPPS